MRILFFIFFIFSQTINSYSKSGENTGLVKGSLADGQGQKIPYATVMLKNAKDSSLYKGELTNENGEFVFENLKTGNYYLEIKHVMADKKIIGAINISTDRHVYELGVIEIKPSDKALQTVNVVADKPFIERQADKMVVNIENSIIHSGSSLLEVMEKLPAVQVNQDGRVSLKGKPSVVILMDGKPMGVAGQDLSNILRGMPSANIQKIEIITNPSARYDAAGNAGIINIVTKKNRKEGFNGSANSSYGQGRYEKMNTGFTLGYKNKKVNLFASYNYSRRRGFNNLKLTRRFFRNDSLNTVFETYNYIIYPFKTHSPRMGADFYLSKKTTVSLIGSGAINNFNPSAINFTDIKDGNNNKVSKYYFENQSNDKFRNYSINSQIKHQFDSTGMELSMDLDYATYWNITDQVFTTLYYDANDNLTGEKILIGDQDGDLSIYSAKADFTKPLKNNLKIDAGAKSSYVAMNSDVKFYNKVLEQNTFDSTQSNHFLYNENINAGYLNFNKEFKKLSVQLGLRGEQTVANGHQVITGQKFNRNYFQFFPSVFFDYKFNEKHGINMNLARRIDRPAYEQMNPFKKLIDATTYSTGNPSLLPQLTYNSEIGYSFLNSLFLTLGYSYTYNNITDVLIQDSEKRLTIQTIVNLAQYHSYSANLVFSKKLTKWWTTNSSLFSYYGLFVGTVNNYNLNQGYPSFTFNTSNSFAIGKGFSAELGFLYNHKSLYGVTLMNATHNLTIGVQKSVLKKRGSLVLNYSDIFWRAWPSGFTDFGNVNESWAALRDTRVLNLSFNYRFGKGQSKMRRNTGADEEKSRAA